MIFVCYSIMHTYYYYYYYMHVPYNVGIHKSQTTYTKRQVAEITNYSVFLFLFVHSIQLRVLSDCFYSLERTKESIGFTTFMGRMHHMCDRWIALYTCSIPINSYIMNTRVIDRWFITSKYKNILRIFCGIDQHVVDSVQYIYVLN